MSRASDRAVGGDGEPAAGELRLERIGKRFDGQRAVADVSLSMRPAERVAVVGPSGAGKTTLLRLMSGAIPPDDGRVTLGGKPVATGDVTMAYQGGTLVDRRTALANVLVGRSAALPWWRGLLEPLVPRDPEPALEALRAVGLGDEARTRADRLSAGQRQRVAFARALVQRSPVVLADEPTANLDPGTRETVLDVLERSIGDRLLVTVLHDVDLAIDRYDRIVALEDGRLQFDRPADDVNNTLLAELFESTGSGGRRESNGRTETDTDGSSGESTAVPYWHA